LGLVGSKIFKLKECVGEDLVVFGLGF